jgi:hypothetical protein
MERDEQSRFTFLQENPQDAPQLPLHDLNDFPFGTVSSAFDGNVGIAELS